MLTSSLKEVYLLDKPFLSTKDLSNKKFGRGGVGCVVNILTKKSDKSIEYNKHATRQIN
jgi:hypothetical protein